MSNEKSFNNDKGFRKLLHDIFSPDIEVIGKAVEEIQERIDKSKYPYGKWPNAWQWDKAPKTDWSE